MPDDVVPPSQWTDRQRLAILRGFAPTETDELTMFDELVRLTARLLDRPVGIVSLVEEDRQWFLARYGVDLAETPIDMSICRHVLRARDVVVIEDTLRDARTQDNPLCTGLDGFRFYAGAVLMTEDGQALGALAVLDTKPGTLDAVQRETLLTLARQVMAQLSLRRALRRSEMLRREVDHRVKNSLQSVAALTRIQSRQVRSPEAREALENVSRRINTVAALNQQMYSAPGDRAVELGSFLESIVTLIRESLPDTIVVNVDSDELHIDARKAGAVAIIVNEFATNSAKHAFPDDVGSVSFEARRMEADTLILTCRDNGTGLAQGTVQDGLGLAIIDSAIDQLAGAKTVLRAPGHGLQIVFGI